MKWAQDMKQYLEVAEVLRPQGLRGEIKVRPWTDLPETLTALKTVYLQENGQYTPLSIRSARAREGFVYLQLQGMDSPEAAEALRGAALYAARAELGEMGEDTQYIADLIGCRAVDENGQELGTLQDVLQYGPTDVYVFQSPQGDGWLRP